MMSENMDSGKMDNKNKRSKMFNISSIIIVKTSGTAKVFLHTDLPLATYPFRGNQSILFDVAQGGGEEYCMINFPGVPREVVNEKEQK